MSKVVIITGAERGLGKAFAIGLSRAGHTIVATGRDQKELAKIASRLQGDYLVLKCDITRPDECHAVFAKTVEAFGKVDVLINNAGIYTQNSFAAASPIEVKQIFDVVVTGTATMSSLALEEMKVAKSGQIINMLDVSIKDGVIKLGEDNSHAIDKAAKYAKRVVSLATAKEADAYGVVVTDFYLKWVASAIDIDDAVAAPKGATHPVDAVKEMVRVIQNNAHEVTLPTGL